jgi:transposase
MYGLLTDHAGRPIAVETYAGNTADPTTVPEQVRKLRQRFGLTHVVLVGDRGLLTQTQIDTLKRYPGLGWIAALRAPAIRTFSGRGPYRAVAL